jgi:hypothetical protein
MDAWTLRAWPNANTLTPADGDKVRETFQSRLALACLQKILDDDLPPAANEETNSGIDKSVLALPEAKKGQATTAFCGKTILPRLRTRALRPAPFAFCATARTSAKSQR